MSIVAAAGDPVAVDAPPPVTAGARFHAMMIIEDTQTGDKRLFAANSMTWPDDLTAVQVPLTADDENHEYHLDAKLVGSFDKIERRGMEIHGYGAYIENPDEDAARLIGLIQAGELRGISVDVDSYEFEILFPTSGTEDPVLDEMMGEDVPPAPTEDVDGVEYEVFPIEQPIERVTAGRIRGACALLFPAFVEAFIEPDGGTDQPAIAASAAPALARYRLTGVMVEPCIVDTTPQQHTTPTINLPPLTADGRFDFPDVPSHDWFFVPPPDEPMALTILDSGQVMGHLAVDGECHIGIQGECVIAPVSPSNYARFHLGEIPTTEGRVAVGHLTFHTGHADKTWNARVAVDHYDNSGSVAADLRAADSEHGVWVCGAMRPGLTAAQIREIMSCPPSGDWRVFGGEHDMVAALAVPVPGFQNAHGRAYIRRDELGMVASAIIVNPAGPTRFVGPQTVDPDIAHRVGALIALSIGRSKKQRVAELSARVHGGR